MINYDMLYSFFGKCMKFDVIAPYKHINQR